MKGEQNLGSSDMKGLGDYAKYFNLVFIMAILIVVGAYGGITLDKTLKTNFPVFSLVGVLLGFVLSIYYLYRKAIK